MGKKILVIDNDREFRRFIGEALSIDGYEVLLESSGYNGIAKAVKERPDLILLDILMPSLNGVSVVRKLRSDPRTASVPVMIVTGEASGEQVAAVLAAGACGVLFKPFSLNTLYSEIRKTLSAR